MNARKHRHVRQAKEADRLEPKGASPGGVFVTIPTRTKRRPVHRADLNHPAYSLQNMEKLSAPSRLATGQTSPQGGSGGAAWRGPKKPTPGHNAPDMPTSVWSRLARQGAEPPLERPANDG